MTKDYKDKIRKNVEIDPVTGCWNWKRSLMTAGYGQTRYHGQNTLAHRVAYLEFKGEIPEGMFVCHRCDNKRCCNVDHHFLGDARANTQDAVDKGLIPRGEQLRRSKLTETQVREIRAKYIPWEYTCQMLADEYGVAQQHISWIIRKGWKHVA